MKLAYTVASPETQDPNMLAWRGADLHPVCDHLASLGYAGIDLMLRDPHALDSRHIESAVKASGLNIAAISTGQLAKEEKLALNMPDPQRAIEKVKAVVDLAADWKAQVNIGTLRGQISPMNQQHHAAAALSTITAYAGARAVTIAIEPQTRAVCNWLNTTAEAIAWMSAYTDQPKILFDVYHALLEEPSIYAALITSRPSLSYVQLSDTNRLAPGRGTLAFGDILRVLHALNYTGYLCIECRQWPTSAEAARQAAAHLTPYLKEFENR